MNATRRISLACSFVLLAASFSAQAEFVLEMEAPAFRVQIPSLPPMRMEPRPMAAGRPHLRLMGFEGPFTVTVLTPTADAGMTAQDCAGSTIGALPARPGVPTQDRIYKARIDANTFVAIYVSPMPGFVQLHAHLVSAAGGTHCVEVHASRTSTSKEDIDLWFKGFGSARIEPRLDVTERIE
jgi:hypothetical protein